jgi:hypothetical protein
MPYLDKLLISVALPAGPGERLPYAAKFRSGIRSRYPQLLKAGARGRGGRWDVPPKEIIQEVPDYWTLQKPLSTSR